MIGVFSDSLCNQHGVETHIPHVERCELVRHCRWVDEVIPEAPWRLDEVFLRARRIDYVAIDEGASINPAYEKERIKGYDMVKSLSKYLNRTCRGDIADLYIQIRLFQLGQLSDWYRQCRPPLT